MRYARNNIWNKRLPRSLGIVVLLLSLVAIFWLSRNAVLLGSKAAISNVPKNVQISNISSTGFTVSYITDASITGSVSFGLDSKFGKVAFDTRDASTPLPHSVHYINITGLSPSKKYFFSIVSGDAIFLNNSIPYELTTPPTITDTSGTQQSLSGVVTLDGKIMPIEAVAYVSSKNSQVLSILLKPEGTYALPLNTILKKDLTGALNIAPNEILRLQIVSPGALSNASVLASQASSVPPIILSKDYDFSISTKPLTPVASESAQVSGFPASEQTQDLLSPQILTPKSSQEFKDQQPQFSGKALPGNDVEISIQSAQEITTTIQADNNGNWQYRPATKLAPGQHTLTIKTLDASGLIKTISQSFTVFAEGSQFIEPSISPTSIPAPTVALPTPTTEPTVIVPTATPTPIIIITTPIVTLPESSPAPQITTPPIPNSGSSALIFGIIGTILSVGIGGLIFLLL